MKTTFAEARGIAISIVASVIASGIYSLITSTLASTDTRTWVAANKAEVFLFATTSGLASFLTILYIRMRVERITIYCPFCPERVEDFRRLPGRYVIGCRCKSQMLVRIDDHFRVDISPFTALDDGKHRDTSLDHTVMS